MTLNVNGTAMSLVYADGTRMKVVNVNGTEVYRADTGNVTLVYTGAPSGSFSPGGEDVNRHFVLVGTRFSGDPLSSPTTPTIGGTSMNVISAGAASGADGGISGVYAIKIPTGTADITVAQTGTTFSNVAIYRVIGISEMTSATALSSGTSGSDITGAKTSSANGCFFGAAVENFASPPTPTPNSTGLTYFTTYTKMVASNTTTGPTQTVSVRGSQINSFAIFGYDLY